MRFFTALILIGLCSLQFANATQIKIGSSYNEVIAALGEPDGELNAGSRKILTYGQAQVKFNDGKVSSISAEFEKLLADRDADKASVEAKRKANLVNYKGKWMRPSEHEALIAKEQKEQAAQAAEAAQSSRTQGSTGWMTNYSQALDLAKAQNKRVLLNFTGSDWCGWCIKLDNEVFSQKAFLDYAKDNYILVKLDFPRRSSLPEGLKRQNENLAKQYKVRGFPTVVVLNSNGKPYKTGGYVRGGPAAFIQSLN